MSEENLDAEGRADLEATRRKFPGVITSRRPTIWTAAGRRDAKTGDRIEENGILPYNQVGESRRILEFPSSRQLQAETDSRNSLPTIPARINFNGPSVGTQRTTIDKPFHSQGELRLPQVPEDAARKEHPPIARGEASVWRNGRRVVIAQGAHSGATERA